MSVTFKDAGVRNKFLRRQSLRLNNEVKMSTPNVSSNRFLKAKVVKKSKFMNEDIDLNKLTVAQVLEIQGIAGKDEGSVDNLKVLSTVIRFGAPELAEFSDEELQDFPLDELTKLSNEIMKYSGLAVKD